MLDNALTMAKKKPTAGKGQPPKRKQPKERKAQMDRNQARRISAVYEELAAQLDKLLERRVFSNFTQEVNRAVQEMLEREGLWPPPGGDGFPQS